MAIASFFDKAALAASQVLQGIDYDALTTELDRQVVGVAFDDAAAESPEGGVTLGLTVNLLARLYPRLALMPHGDRAAVKAAELAAAARAINPVIEITDDQAGVTAVLAVGTTAVSAAVPIVYVGSTGWVARLSPDEPVGSGPSANPFGAAAAACFGAASIFRLLFGAYLPAGALDSPVSLSLLDLEPNTDNPANPELGPVDLGESVLVGLGAIGNAAVWALARTPGLRGTLHLVDHQTVDLSNLQRYLLTTQQSIGAVKVNLARAALAGSPLDVRPHQARWGDFLLARDDWRLPCVAVALDSAEDRRAVQAALPHWVVNAWTQPGDLGVSRHPFLGDGACLTCLYFPDESERSEEHVIAAALGLPDAAKEIGRLLYTGTPVGRGLLERAATALGVAIEPLLAFEGRPLQSFYSEAVCGGLVFRLGAGTNTHPAAVPLAFQSALVGILLAAELVVHASELRGASLPVTTRLDLLRPLQPQLSVRVGKPASGRCICQDSDYIARYHSKYSLDT